MSEEKKPPRKTREEVEEPDTEPARAEASSPRPPVAEQGSVDKAGKASGDDEAGEEAVPLTEVVVTVSEDALSEFATIVGRLEKAGLTVDNVLDFIGQVSGRCSGDDVEALRRIDGVAAVEVSERIQLAPPGSLIQ